MKTTLICIALLTFAMNSFGQQANNKHPLSSEEYLLKSEEQKSTAWILLGIGTVSMAAGFVIVSDPDFDLLEEDLTGVSILIFGGGLLDVITIPLFISSSKNKRRGMEASTTFKMEGIPPNFGYSPMSKAIPAVAVKVSF